MRLCPTYVLPLLDEVNTDLLVSRNLIPHFAFYSSSHRHAEFSEFH